MSIRVMIAVDHPVVREGLRSLIERAPGMEITGEASDGQSLLDLVARQKADVYIVDIIMPVLNGMETTRKLLKTDPDVGVVILSIHNSLNFVGQALAVGAKGYVAKESVGEDSDFRTQRQQQKLAAIGRLSTSVAHEVNNPLTGIMGYAQLIADMPGIDPVVAGHAREILSSAGQIGRLVENLLSFSRTDPFTSAAVSISEITGGVMTLARSLLARDFIAIELAIPTNLPTIKCSSHQMQQVILNLVMNARDALNSRYPGRHPDKIIKIIGQSYFRRKRCWVRLTVEDSGTGIPLDIREMVFDPFFTTKSDGHGTGLGLAISLEIVKEHRGRLEFETEVGKGTKFFMDLPAEAGN